MQKYFLVADSAASIYVAVCGIIALENRPVLSVIVDPGSLFSTIIPPIAVGNISLSRETECTQLSSSRLITNHSLLSILSPGSHLLIGFQLCSGCPIPLMPRE